MQFKLLGIAPSKVQEMGVDPRNMLIIIIIKVFQKLWCSNYPNEATVALACLKKAHMWSRQKFSPARTAINLSPLLKNK